MSQTFSLRPCPEPALTDALTALEEIVLGKTEKLRLALVCLIAGGHLLIEDIPGVGKTTLAHALAGVLGLEFHRIQFTSDLLPADIIGTTVFERTEERFSFRRGPLFSQLVLADEINRATPRAQSALLEAMQEGQVSVDGATLALPRPFFVIATQNPLEQAGTYPLPESQLDRFAMRLTLGYPDAAAERRLYQATDRHRLLERIKPVLDTEQVLSLQRRAATITLAPALLDYIQALIAHSRDRGLYLQGLSPRAGLMLVHLAQAHALLAGHAAVVPEDVQAIVAAAVAHRLRPRNRQQPVANIGLELIEAVAIP